MLFSICEITRCRKYILRSLGTASIEIAKWLSFLHYKQRKIPASIAHHPRADKKLHFSKLPILQSMHVLSCHSCPRYPTHQTAILTLGSHPPHCQRTLCIYVVYTISAEHRLGRTAGVCLSLDEVGQTPPSRIRMLPTYGQESWHDFFKNDFIVRLSY